MKKPAPKWDLLCKPAVFETLRAEESFWQIVALARAVNALSFAHWVMEPALKDKSQNGIRTRNNSFLFTCGVLYEALLLVEKMHKHFGRSEAFNNGLRKLSRDKTARKVRTSHLEPARNNVVFHFLPPSFGKLINIPGDYECLFASGEGNIRKQIYYPFADLIATEFLVGFAGDHKRFYDTLDTAMMEIRTLARSFADAADHLIRESLAGWGFGMRITPAPTKRRQPTKR